MIRISKISFTMEGKDKQKLGIPNEISLNEMVINENKLCNDTLCEQHSQLHVKWHDHVNKVR